MTESAESFGEFRTASDFTSIMKPWVVLSREVGELRPQLQKISDRAGEGKVSDKFPDRTGDFRNDLNETVAELTRQWQAALACGRAVPRHDDSAVLWLTGLVRSQREDVRPFEERLAKPEDIQPVDWLGFIARLKHDISLLADFIAKSGRTVNLRDKPYNANSLPTERERYALVASNVRAEAELILKDVLEKSSEASALLEKSKSILEQVKVARAALGEVAVLKRLKELGKDLRVRSRYLKRQQRASTRQAYWVFGLTALAVVLTILFPKFGEPLVDLTWRVVVSLAGFSVGFFLLKQAGAYRRMSFIVDHRRQNAELYRSVLSEGLPADEEKAIRAKLLDRLARDPQFDIQRGAQDEDMLDILKGIATRAEK